MHRHLLHNAVFWEYVLVQTHPSPRGYTQGPDQKTTGGKREREKNSCRHNQMSHRSAVLLCTVCLSVIYLVFTVAALCMKTDRRVCIDRWKVCVIRIKTRQAEMLKVNRLRCASCVVDDSCHQRLLLHLTRFAQTREILCSPTPPRINSHGVVAALLFGFEEAHGEESACLQTQHEYDAAYEAGHVELGLGELGGGVGVAVITLRERTQNSLVVLYIYKFIKC